MVYVKRSDLDLPVVVTEHADSAFEEIPLGDLVALDESEKEECRMVSVKSKGIVQFLVLCKKNDGGDDSWQIPLRKDFHKIINYVECLLFKESHYLLTTKAWANMWNGMGVLGLNVRDVKRYKEFKDVFERSVVEDMKFTIYPRDGLLSHEELTALLRDDLESFDISLIPTALYWCNHGLSGQCRVSKVKTFGDQDKTRGGQPKKKWQLIKL